MQRTNLVLGPMEEHPQVVPDPVTGQPRTERVHTPMERNYLLGEIAGMRFAMKLVELVVQSDRVAAEMRERQEEQDGEGQD